MLVILLLLRYTDKWQVVLPDSLAQEAYERCTGTLKDQQPEGCLC